MHHPAASCRQAECDKVAPLAYHHVGCPSQQKTPASNSSKDQGGGKRRAASMRPLIPTD